MRLTHNSLATMIAWVSTCLLAGGVSTLFSDNARTLWMTWGSFGLAAAVGLDIAARVRLRRRTDRLNLKATKRFERDMNYANEENEANVAIREAVTRLLGQRAKVRQNGASRRTLERIPCDLEVELQLMQGDKKAASNHSAGTRFARIINLSEAGFQLTLTDKLPQQRMKMNIAAANGSRQMMLGEVLWCSPQPGGSIVAGGRFLNVISDEDD